MSYSYSSKSLFSLFLFIVFSLSYSASAFACACCAEPGVYIEEEAKLEDWIVDGFKKIQFESASLYNPSGEPVKLDGFNSKAQNFAIRLKANGDRWELVFIDPQKHKTLGMLTFKKPKNLFRLTKELPSQSVRNTKQESIVAFTQVKFKVKAKASGIFTKDADLEFALDKAAIGVCLDIEGFGQYTIKVSTDKDSYHFYGKLKGAN